MLTTKEIEGLTGKAHKHILRDVKTMIKQGAINGTNFGLTSIETPMPKGGTRKTPMYELDFDATMTLVAPLIYSTS